MNNLFGDSDDPGYLNEPSGDPRDVESEAYRAAQAAGWYSPGQAGERGDVGGAISDMFQRVKHQVQDAAQTASNAGLVVTDGRWTYALEPDGDLKIISGPSLVGQSFSRGSSQHTAMMSNLMAYSSDQAARIRAYTQGSKSPAPAPAPAPAPTRNEGYFAPAPVPEEPAGITDSWWFWPAVGIGAVVVAGVAYRSWKR